MLRVLAGGDHVEDYVELGLGGDWCYNPLEWVPSTTGRWPTRVASLLNQLFGKGKEPF